MRALRLIHRWIGIAIALPMVLVALSGALLVFRDAYYRARWPVVAAAITPQERHDQPRILQIIDTRFAQAPLRSVKFPRQGVNAFHLYLPDSREAFVDPRTGELIAQWNARTDPAAFLFDLHAHLLMGARGELLNGYAALVLVFLSMSGLLLWWPRRSAAFRLRYAVPRDAGAAALLRSHAAAGALVSAGVVLFSATGAGLVFYEPAGRVVSALLDASAPVTPAGWVQPSAVPRAAWPAILEAGRTALPEAGPTMYYPGANGNAVITFRKRLPGESHPNGRSYVLVDPYTARVVQAIDARAQGAGTRLMHAIYPIHAAKTGGVALATAAVITGLGLAWLAIGGTWSYVARRVRPSLVAGARRTQFQRDQHGVEQDRHRVRDNDRRGGDHHAVRQPQRHSEHVREQHQPGEILR